MFFGSAVIRHIRAFKNDVAKSAKTENFHTKNSSKTAHDQNNQAKEANISVEKVQSNKEGTLFTLHTLSLLLPTLKIHHGTFVVCQIYVFEKPNRRL